MANTIEYSELNTQDPEAAKTFYRGLFDWRMEDSKMPNGATYTSLTSGGDKKALGGVLRAQDAAGGSRWIPYVSVDDVAASTAKAKRLGAKAVAEMVEIPEGRFSVLVDPTGAVFGIWQKAAA